MQDFRAMAFVMSLMLLVLSWFLLVPRSASVPSEPEYRQASVSTSDFRLEKQDGPPIKPVEIIRFNPQDGLKEYARIRVIDEERNPVHGATIYWSQAGLRTSQLFLNERIETDNHGEALVDPPPDPAAILSVFHPLFAPTSIPALEEGANHVVTLLSGTSLTASFKTIDGQPVSGYTITISQTRISPDTYRGPSPPDQVTLPGPDAKTRFQSAVSDDNGWCSIANILPGDYYVSARHEDFVAINQSPSHQIRIPTITAINIDCARVMACAVRYPADYNISHGLVGGPIRGQVDVRSHPHVGYFVGALQRQLKRRTRADIVSVIPVTSQSTKDLYSQPITLVNAADFEVYHIEIPLEPISKVREASIPELVGLEQSNLEMCEFQVGVRTPSGRELELPLRLFSNRFHWETQRIHTAGAPIRAAAGEYLVAPALNSHRVAFKAMKIEVSKSTSEIPIVLDRELFRVVLALESLVPDSVISGKVFLTNAGEVQSYVTQRPGLDLLLESGRWQCRWESPDLVADAVEFVVEDKAAVDGRISIRIPLRSQ